MHIYIDCNIIAFNNHFSLQLSNFAGKMSYKLSIIKVETILYPWINSNACPN